MGDGQTYERALNKCSPVVVIILVNNELVWDFIVFHTCDFLLVIFVSCPIFLIVHPDIARTFVAVGFQSVKLSDLNKFHPLSHLAHYKRLGVPATSMGKNALFSTTANNLFETSLFKITCCFICSSSKDKEVVFVAQCIRVTTRLDQVRLRIVPTR